MLNCRRATDMMSQAMDRPLHWRERFGLRVHLMFCGACRRCRVQFQHLRMAARLFASGRDDAADRRTGQDGDFQ